jgi:hypothetical protein
MTYAADLTEVLRSLLDVIVETDLPERTSWLVLRTAYEEYEYKGSRQRIHGRIREKFKQDKQTLDQSDFRYSFSELLRGEHPSFIQVVIGYRRIDMLGRFHAFASLQPYHLHCAAPTSFL